MFFRRQKPKELTFEDRLAAVRQAGFTVEPAGAGRVKVSRDGCAAVLEEAPGGRPRLVHRAGILMGDAIGTLVDAGYQKFFQTPAGAKKPALAGELKTLHEFEEDLRDALGLPMLYNESLGTVSNLYHYDRVQGRDQGVKRLWE